MFAKSYSIALPLLGAFFLTGCAQPTPMPYDIPTLLFSDFKTAEKILGKSNSYVILPLHISSQGISAATWSLSDDFSMIMYYRESTNIPTGISLTAGKNAPKLDKAAFLERFNLQTDSPDYKVLLDSPRHKKFITGATTEPRSK